MERNNPITHKSGRDKLLDTLFKQKGFRCAICGRNLTPETSIIDHKLPLSMGGTNDYTNLQLVCTACNARAGKYSYLGYQFELYIQQLLHAHSDYEIIDSHPIFNQENMRPDLVFRKQDQNHEDSIFIAEVKLATSFTEHRILQVISQLLKHQEKMLDTQLVFITSAELPQTYKQLLNDNGIILWDKTFISREFSVQIASTNKSQFYALFHSEDGENEGTLTVNESINEFDSLINELRTCPAGKEHWGEYEKLVGKLLEKLFCPPLELPLPQHNDRSKVNRRDYVLPNYSRNNDSWDFLRNRYNAEYVVVDAKNSGKHVTKQDVFQIANYLKADGTGLFGIIISRKGTNNASDYTVREMWRYEGKMIVVFNDADVEQMILAKKNGSDPAKLILKKIEDFRLSI